MSNYIGGGHDFEEDDDQFQSQVNNGSPTDTSLTEPATTDVSGPMNHPPPSKKKRNLPGNPDPDAEVMALSPRTLMATNRYICEVCHKGFQRDQNLQLHRRGHNLPWKLKQRAESTRPRKRVYICPEPSCVHHDPARALGDLTGIKKPFCRKHGEKKWKCDKCSKKYAVQSDWKAHAKICGTREYRCDCGTIFSRKDSFVTHRAFCDALTEENKLMMSQRSHLPPSNEHTGILKTRAPELFASSLTTTTDTDSSAATLVPHLFTTTSTDPTGLFMTPPLSLNPTGFMMMPSSLDPFGHRAQKPVFPNGPVGTSAPAYASATALLQKAAEMGAKISDNTIAPILLRGFSGYNTETVLLDNSSTSSSNNNNRGDNAMMNGISNPVHNQQIGAGFLPADGVLQGVGEEKIMTVDFLGVDHDGSGRGFHETQQQNMDGFQPGW